METISSVKFATLHNDKTIFYSHIDHLHQVFDKIKSIDHEVILITGAGDISVTNFSAPSNVKYWFAQNCLVQHEKIIPIPIGLRNSFPHHINNQNSILSGCDYYWGQLAEKLLTEIYLNLKSTPNEFIYANFNVDSNLGYRPFLRKICEQIPFINYESPVEDNNGYQNYYSKILNHQANFCPIGNGIDTHRIWETLYCKRVAITLNCNCNKYPKISQGTVGESFQIPPQDDEYAIYTKLYSQLPIIILNSYEELIDRSYLEKLIEEKKNQKHNLDLINFNYWKKLIIDLEKTLDK